MTHEDLLNVVQAHFRLLHSEFKQVMFDGHDDTRYWWTLHGESGGLYRGMIKPGGPVSFQPGTLWVFMTSAMDEPIKYTFPTELLEQCDEGSPQ